MTLHYKILYNLLIISFLISLTACHKKERDDKTEQRLFMKTIVVDGLTRRYAIYIPKNLNTKNPLIFELHGGGIYIEDMTGESGHKTPYKLWMELADTEKFIVVYPE